MNRREDPRIIVLYNQESGVAYGEPKDIIALQYTSTVARCIYEALAERGYPVALVAVQDSLRALRQTLKGFSPGDTFIFNNCDGFRGDNQAVTQVIRLLEELGFAHTGSTAAVTRQCIDKRRTKRTLMAAGIPTPRYQIYTEAGNSFRWRFPAIVKPLASDASLGIDLEAVVVDSPQLVQRVAYVIERYRQPALVEEFIPGREVAVSLWGNGETVEVLPIAEHDFSLLPNPLHHLLTYDAKWLLDSYLAEKIVTRCPAALGPQDMARIMAVARQTFQVLGLRDLARIDIRYDGAVPYVIDVNEIPDLAPEAGFARSAYAAGYSYGEMVERILQIAFEREQWLCNLAVKSVRPNLKMVNASLK